MLFFSFFKTLVNNQVTVELKNDISIRGTLKSVDQYLNIKLEDISVVDELKYPHLVRVWGGALWAEWFGWHTGGTSALHGRRHVLDRAASSACDGLHTSVNGRLVGNGS
jgi:small nuclear ribonucleoprotein (snRNP)-like protein